MKIAIGIVLIVLICIMIYSATKKLPGMENVRFISAQEFNALVEVKDPNTVLLDVRTSKEFDDGHIAGALNIDFYASDFKPQLSALDPAKTYLVYCRSGHRTRQAVSIMGTVGFKNIVVLEHGLMDWLANKLPTVK